MKKYIVSLLALLLVSLTSMQGVAGSEQAFRHSVAQRVIVVGDIHGAIDDLSGLLRAAGVVDNETNWRAGKTHFVSVGDLLDRGPDSRAIMDLFMRLEKQAEQAGGAVHLILGNHELMNLVRDLRYVNAHDYARYQADEEISIREAHWQHYLAQAIKIAKEMSSDIDEAAVRDAFERDYPPGFFAHLQEFAPQGKYGRWLLSKPSAIIINDTIFVHGGLSEAFPLIGLSNINHQANTTMRDYIASFNALKQRALLSDQDDFFDRQEKLKQVPPNQLDDEARRWYQTFLSADQSFYLAADSQFWYRGSALCHPIYEEEILDRALQHFQVRRLIIGHTPTFSRKIESRMNGKVINVDTGLYRQYYHGTPMLLAIEGNKLEQFDGHGWQPFSVQGPAYRETYRGYTYPQWENMLRDARIISAEGMESGIATTAKLELEHNGMRFQATFNSHHSVPRNASRQDYANTRSYKYEVAAYRLARHIGLHMVPPVVLKEIEGKQGALQLWPMNSISEAERITRGEYPSEPCEISYQASLMSLFDVLIYNAYRTQDTVRYTSDWHMWLSDHSRSFMTFSEAPPHLQSAQIRYSPKLEQALRLLDKATLETLADDLLQGKQVRAILKRRDWLLDHWAAQ